MVVPIDFWLDNWGHVDLSFTSAGTSTSAFGVNRRRELTFDESNPLPAPVLDAFNTVAGQSLDGRGPWDNPSHFVSENGFKVNATPNAATKVVPGTWSSIAYAPPYVRLGEAWFTTLTTPGGECWLYVGGYWCQILADGSSAVISDASGVLASGTLPGGAVLAGDSLRLRVTDVSVSIGIKRAGGLWATAVTTSPTSASAITDGPYWEFSTSWTADIDEAGGGALPPLGGISTSTFGLNQRRGLRFDESELATPALDTFDAGASQSLSSRTGWANSVRAVGLGDFSTDSVPTKAVAGVGGGDNVWGTPFAGGSDEAWLQLADWPGFTGSFQVYARWTTAATTKQGYRLSHFSGNWNLQRWDAGAPAVTIASGAVSLIPSDRLRIRCIGTLISAWCKQGNGPWTLLGSGTDATYSGGNIAMTSDAAGINIAEFGGGVPVSTGGVGTSAFGLNRRRSLALASTGTGTSAFGISRRRNVTLSSSGVGTSAFSLGRIRALALTSTGSGTSAFGINRRRSLALSSTGTGTNSFAINRLRNLALSSSGVGTSAFGLNRRRDLALTSTGAGTSAFGIDRLRALALTSTGSGTSAFGINRRRNLTLSSAGAGTSSFAINRLRDLALASSGVGTSTFGITHGSGLTLTSTGVGTSAFSLGRIRALAFTSAGSATSSFALSRRRSLSLASSGVGTSTFGLSRRRSLALSSAGSGASTFALARVRALSLTSTGSGASTFALARRRSLALTSAGAGTTSFGLNRRRDLSFDSTGTGTSSFAPSLLGRLVGDLVVRVESGPALLVTLSAGTLLSVSLSTSARLVATLQGPDDLDASLSASNLHATVT